jgi:hypothetical protein
MFLIRIQTFCSIRFLIQIRIRFQVQIFDNQKFKKFTVTEILNFEENNAIILHL